MIARRLAQTGPSKPSMYARALMVWAVDPLNSTAFRNFDTLDSSASASRRRIPSLYQTRLNEPDDAGVVSGLAGMASRWEGLVAQDQPFIRRPSRG